MVWGHTSIVKVLLKSFSESCWYDNTEYDTFI